MDNPPLKSTSRLNSAPPRHKSDIRSFTNLNVLIAAPHQECLSVKSRNNLHQSRSPAGESVTRVFDALWMRVNAL
jgi:hypothetical protein